MKYVVADLELRKKKQKGEENFKWTCKEMPKWVYLLSQNNVLNVWCAF